MSMPKQSKYKSNKQSNKGLSNPALYVVGALFSTLPMGIMGAVLGYMGENSNALTGFLWGVGIAVALGVVMLIGYFGWEWMKNDADNGRLRPYMLGGLIVAIVISGWLAMGLGEPSCEEYGDAPYNSCTSYADDGFEVTSGQVWDYFWRKLPPFLLICLLIAYIAHSQVEKNRPKHFKSENDGFSVGIFPENISLDQEDGANHYKYKTFDNVQYAIYVSNLEPEEHSRLQQNQHKSIVSWHEFTVSNVTGLDYSEVKYNDGKKQKSPYVYGSYNLKKDIIYYHLTVARDRKLYELSMYIQPNENDNKTSLDKIFFEFVDSFKFTKKEEHN